MSFLLTLMHDNYTLCHILFFTINLKLLEF